MHRFEIDSRLISIAVREPPGLDRWHKAVIVPLLKAALKRRAWTELPTVYVKPFRTERGALLGIDWSRTRNPKAVMTIIALAEDLGLPIRVYALKGKWSYYRELKERGIAE